ncbi:hypothetical protein A2U01_0053602 [Trifolium medium]|uniref:Uncharacterized protein n=1 Tax=Trifolium medium TaxID=97028 RepID=A0A392R807_9FABA|nr:hypothetical protein [Trifolium medium]
MLQGCPYDLEEENHESRARDRKNHKINTLIAFMKSENNVEVVILTQHVYDGLNQHNMLVKSVSQGLNKIQTERN